MTSSHMKTNKTTAGIINQGGNIFQSGNIYVNNPSTEEIDFDEFHLPPLITTFKGREQEIEDLASTFFEKDQRKVVICGLPGFGKTELAKHFARYCNILGKVDKVFWMNSDKPKDLINSFRSLSKLLKVSIKDNKVLVQYIYQHFIKYKCIFIFDNARSRLNIAEFEPPANYYLLITSQEKNWGWDIKSHELQPLCPAAAVEVYKTILKDYYKEEESELYEVLANTFGNVPLGLQVSGAYVRQGVQSLGPKFELQKYIKTIKLSMKKIMNAEIPEFAANTYGKSLYGAIRISLDKITNERDIQVRELALNILFICAYLHPEEIYYNEILLKMSNVYELLRKNSNNTNSFALALALSLLDNFSFVAYNPIETKIKIHSFIQNILRFHLSEYNSHMQSKCYSACLQFIFENDNNFFTLVQHSTTILAYADINVNIVYNFYVKHKKNRNVKSSITNKIFEKMFVDLVQHGCTQCLKKIFKNNKLLTKKYINDFTLLHYSILCNQLDILHLLLKYNVDVNTKDHKNETPLHVAAFKGNLEAIQILINQQADLNAKTNEGNTVLFEYFVGTNINLQEIDKILNLLNCSNNKSITNDKGESLLHIAAATFQAEVVNLLVTKYNINVNVQDNHVRTPLHTLISRATKDDILRASETAKSLISCGASLDVKDANNKTPFEFAQDKKLDYLIELFYFYTCSNKFNVLCKIISYNQLDILKRLLETHNFDINTTDEDQDTILHIAAFKGNVEIINLLIEHNADLNSRNRYGDTPLFEFLLGTRSTQINLENIIKILDLLNCYDNRNITNNEGKSLVHIASTTFQTDLIELLVNKYKINVNKQDINGRTPLLCLLRRQENDTINVRATVKALIKSGASLDIKDANNMTPLKLSVDYNLGYPIGYFFDFNKNAEEYTNKFNLLHDVVRRNKLDILNMLMKYNIDVNHKDEKQHIALHVAAFEGNLQAVKILLKHNANSFARTKDGATPLFELLRGVRYREYVNLDEMKQILDLLTCTESKYTTKYLGDTLLHEAVASYNETLVKFLITNYDMNVNAKNKFGYTPLHTVISSENIHFRKEEDVILTVEVLKEFGARLDMKTKYEMTPLRLAQLHKPFLVPYLRLH